MEMHKMQNRVQRGWCFAPLPGLSGAQTGEIAASAKGFSQLLWSV